MKLFGSTLLLCLSGVCITVIADDTDKPSNKNTKNLRRRNAVEENHVTAHLFAQENHSTPPHLAMEGMTTPKRTQGVVSRRVIIKYKSGHKANLMDTLVVAERNIRTAGLPDMRVNLDLEELDSLVVTAEPALVEALQHSPEVEYIEEDPIRFPLSSSINDHASSKEHRLLQESIPYGVNLVQAPEVWARGFTGEGVKVCVIDSGIDRTHPDFVRSKLSGASANIDWGEDGCGHGTHVAGTIAGERSNGQGVVGVAPDAEIFTVRVFRDNCAFAYGSEIYNAARTCKANNANIVSMSLGGPSQSNAERQAFDDLYDAGVLLIAAAGNGGNQRRSYPASYSSVMSVAAVDNNKNHASFSQRNTQVDIAAPGVGILSTFPIDGCQICPRNSNGYGAIDGTSMATPHVSGVAALLWQAIPDASASRLREALQNSAQDLGTPGRDTLYGKGLVQAVSALDYLEGPPPPPNTNCRNFPSDWFDSDGSDYTCEWYAQGTNCISFGDGYENGGYTANEACCACGGGTDDNNAPPATPPPVSTPPPVTPPPTTRAPISPSPTTSSPTTSSPTTAPPSAAPVDNNDDPSASCIDINGWHDIDGPEYDCNFYAIGLNCYFHGDSFMNEGETANTACCVCGGGTLVDNNDGGGSPTAPPICTDVPDWHDSDGAEYDCDFYADDNNCSEYGAEFSNFGYTANEACCTCGGGNIQE
mmetsp:Transcript_6562/g.8537  ORF Transcript_6562/g.8537 Transcript_6562/m.8537 type:complete len:703 (-) Transcript_6562:138-2246(-)|eukprot:CAMPEP_0195262690 /NCGR_PEP_ID=MMETSP0706-20130129/9895_1 /TAXON_ID=33640 /ORGANISM="Asterionellopsis glacialis, Strain CCMP134" /LENGTH=702 /DNA_ID=CAMNT_0040316799 /DNA_START=32 /DNA_END=2140 /DNA_ORIENTATION=+